MLHEESIAGPRLEGKPEIGLSADIIRALPPSWHSSCLELGGLVWPNKKFANLSCEHAKCELLCIRQ